MNRRALLAAPRLVERTYPGKPMALDYLAAVLKREGWQVTIVDVDVEGMPQYRALLRAGRFHLIGITAMSIQVDEANLLALHARELAPKAVLLRGGAHDTYAYKESCNTHRGLYHAFVVGEGEETLREVATSVSRGSFMEDRGSIRGLCFWDGAVHITGDRGQGDVDRCLPLRSCHHPTYDFDVFGHRKTAQVMATRGCKSACFYCSESVAKRGHHESHRSIESLRMEFEELRRDGYEAVYFDDSTFTRDRAWVLAVCDTIREFGFVWGCNTRVDCLDEDLVRTMRKAGCEYLFCGIESAVPDILRALNKTTQPGVYLDSAVRSYADMRRNGLPCSAFLIFGCPRRHQEDGRVAYVPETDADVRTSLEFAIQTLDPDYLSMNVLRLLPGVPFSFARQFACVRPTGRLPVHGGYYDKTWYSQTGMADIRSTHPVFRAFEGCGSVNPPGMTSARCFEILSLAVELVNQKNAMPGRCQTRIVVDPRFAPFLREDRTRGNHRYLLSSLAEIGAGERRPACELGQPSIGGTGRAWAAY